MKAFTVSSVVKQESIQYADTKDEAIELHKTALVNNGTDQQDEPKFKAVRNTVEESAVFQNAIDRQAEALKASNKK